MKRLLFLLLSITAASPMLQAQKYKHGIGVHFGGLDFYGPQTGDYFRSDKLNAGTLKNEPKYKFDPAIGLSYWYALNKRIDLRGLATVSNLQYPNSDKDSVFINMKNGIDRYKKEFPYAALDARVNYNILPRWVYILTPYVSTGFSFSMRETLKGFDIPVGIGANLVLGKGICLNFASDYRLAMSKNNQNHLMHSAGLVYWFNKEKKAIVPVIPAPLPIAPVKDADKDGIPDNLDECPNEAGRKEMKGCPDRDNDGIADKLDRCPDEKGILKYAGCPMPDADLDGFADELDRCPNVFSKTNGGCPEIKQEVKEKVAKAAKGVNFATGSAKLLPASFANLDILVAILKEDVSIQVDVEGHTDNKGNAVKNTALSQARADACKNYLVSKGIAETRISSTGFGDLNPIGDNNTEAGRAMNRRTEFILKN